MKISVVIPALNEEQAIDGVVQAVPRDLVDEIIVADNGSTDRTKKRASEAGARVVCEHKRGYGAACAAGAKAVQDADIIVFLDGLGPRLLEHDLGDPDSIGVPRPTPRKVAGVSLEPSQDGFLNLSGHGEKG